MKKQHPVAILKYTTKNFWLLLIPLLRGLVALRFDFQKWLSGAYLDIIVLLLIFALAFFRWWFIRYEIGKDCISYSEGVFIRTRFSIPYSTVSAVTANRFFWLRPLRAVSVLIDSDTKSAINKITDPDLKITVTLKDCAILMDNITNDDNPVKLTYNAPKGKLLLFSFVFSSTLSGLIYFGTFLIQGGRLVDNELEERFLTAVNDVTTIAEKVINGITPVTVGFIMLLFAGWLYSFVSNLLRHVNFSIRRRGKDITIGHGFLTKRYYYINSEKINFADLRQNMLMKICSVMSVHVSCSGYGKAKNEIPVFVPVTMKKNVLGVVRMLLPEFKLNGMSAYSHWDYIMRFIGPPTAMIFSVMLAAFAAVVFFPDWYSVILFAAVMGEILSVHFLIVSTASYCTNGAGFENNSLRLNYCRYLQFHSVIIPSSRIASVKIKQTLFQRGNKSCDLIVYTKSETTKAHRVRGLSLLETQEILGSMGISC